MEHRNQPVHYFTIPSSKFPLDVACMGGLWPINSSRTVYGHDPIAELQQKYQLKSQTLIRDPHTNSILEVQSLPRDKKSNALHHKRQAIFFESNYFEHSVPRHVLIPLIEDAAVSPPIYKQRLMAKVSINNHVLLALPTIEKANEVVLLSGNSKINSEPYLLPLAIESIQTSVLKPDFLMVQTSTSLDILSISTKELSPNPSDIREHISMIPVNSFSAAHGISSFAINQHLPEIVWVDGKGKVYQWHYHNGKLSSVIFNSQNQDPVQNYRRVPLEIKTTSHPRLYQLLYQKSISLFDIRQKPESEALTLLQKDQSSLTFYASSPHPSSNFIAYASNNHVGVFDWRFPNKVLCAWNDIDQYSPVQHLEWAKEDGIISFSHEALLHKFNLVSSNYSEYTHFQHQPHCVTRRGLSESLVSPHLNSEAVWHHSFTDFTSERNDLMFLATEQRKNKITGVALEETHHGLDVYSLTKDHKVYRYRYILSDKKDKVDVDSENNNITHENQFPVVYPYSNTRKNLVAYRKLDLTRLWQILEHHLVDLSLMQELNSFSAEDMAKVNLISAESIDTAAKNSPYPMTGFELYQETQPHRSWSYNQKGLLYPMPRILSIEQAELFKMKLARYSNHIICSVNAPENVSRNGAGLLALLNCENQNNSVNEQMSQDLFASEPPHQTSLFSILEQYCPNLNSNAVYLLERWTHPEDHYSIPLPEWVHKARKRKNNYSRKEMAKEMESRNALLSQMGMDMFLHQVKKDTPVDPRRDSSNVFTVSSSQFLSPHSKKDDSSQATIIPGFGISRKAPPKPAMKPRRKGF